MTSARSVGVGEMIEHLRARHEGLRVGEPFVERLPRPRRSPDVLQRVGIVVVGERAGLAPEDAAMAGADVVLVERMAVLAALVELLAAFGVAGPAGRRAAAASRSERGERSRIIDPHAASALSTMASGPGVGDVDDLGDAEIFAQFAGGHELRARRRGGSRRRLREGGRARGVEGHRSLDLLHQLMDVAVEHGHRAEPRQQPQRLSAVVGAPAPFRRDHPQRDVGEHDDRRRSRWPLRSASSQASWSGAEGAEAVGLEVDDVDERNEMHAAVVEGIPTAAGRARAEALQIGLVGRGVEDVVLAGA